MLSIALAWRLARRLHPSPLSEARDEDADERWERLTRSWTELNRGRERWLKARGRLPAVAELLRAAFAASARAVGREFEGAKSAGAPAPAGAGIGDLFADLRQLEAEFEAVEVRWTDKVLVATTEAITLCGVELGPFAVELHWTARCEPGSRFEIVALEPNPAEGMPGVTHPHVRDRHLCAGDAVAPIRRALDDGRIADAFVLVRSVLRTYNPASPYTPLAEWGGSPCAGCGRTVSADDRSCCEGCDADFCESCSRGSSDDERPKAATSVDPAWQRNWSLSQARGAKISFGSGGRPRSRPNRLIRGGVGSSAVGIGPNGRSRIATGFRSGFRSGFRFGSGSAIGTVSGFLIAVVIGFVGFVIDGFVIDGIVVVIGGLRDRGGAVGAEPADEPVLREAAVAAGAADPALRAERPAVRVAVEAAGAAVGVAERAGVEAAGAAGRVAAAAAAPPRRRPRPAGTAGSRWIPTGTRWIPTGTLTSLAQRRTSCSRPASTVNRRPAAGRATPSSPSSIRVASVRSVRPGA